MAGVGGMCVCVCRRGDKEERGEGERHGNSDLENQSNVTSLGNNLAVIQQSTSISGIKPKTKTMFDPWRN